MLNRQGIASALVKAGHITRVGRLARAPLEYVLRHCLKVESVETRIGGKALRLHLDNTCEKKFLMYPFRYYREEFAFIRERFPGDSGVFIDIGANAGLFSFQAACQARSACRVEAFEPNPVMLDRSRANVLRAASFDPGAVTVTLHPIAAGAAEGMSRLDMSLGLGGAFLSPSAAQGPEVPVRRLSEVLRQAGIDHVDMLKIDVEGHEPEALSSLLEPENQNLLPKTMILEYCHRDIWSSDLLGRLAELGYREISRNRNNVFLVR